MKRKQFNDLSRGNTFTNPKPAGECPMSTFGAGVNKEQPMPKKNDNPAIWDLVISEMKERDEIGEKRYGTRLRPWDGRNSLVDAIQEQMDFLVYLRKYLYEDEEQNKILCSIYALLVKNNQYPEKGDIAESVNLLTQLLKKKNVKNVI